MAQTLDPQQYALSTWLRDALCAGLNVDIFFRSGHKDEYSDREAVSICTDCPVQLNCLAYALRGPEEYGVWGGLTPTQRGRYGRWVRRGGQ